MLTAEIKEGERRYSSQGTRTLTLGSVVSAIVNVRRRSLRKSSVSGNRFEPPITENRSSYSDFQEFKKNFQSRRQSLGNGHHERHFSDGYRRGSLVEKLAPADSRRASIITQNTDRRNSVRRDSLYPIYGRQDSKSSTSSQKEGSPRDTPYGTPRDSIDYSYEALEHRRNSRRGSIYGEDHINSSWSGFNMPNLRRRRSSQRSKRRFSTFGGSDHSLSSNEPKERIRKGKGLVLYNKFRFWVKICIIWNRMHKYYLHQIENANRQYGEQLMTIDQAASLGIDKNNDIYFEVNDYKANTQLRVSTEARRILSKPPKERTEQEIYYATIALRSHNEIADYPLRMQRRLAEWGIIESYGPKRVIVRQSHPPQGFYFILFGSCIVAVLKPGQERAETVAQLTRGQSFGELSIISRDKRQSTVITKDDVELLCISARTYENIFMVGGVKNINDPDHNAFMNNIDFLRGWPKEILKPDPDKFVFAAIKRGAVLVKDSNFSKWIIIVKSGSLEVLKKLVRESPNINYRTGKLIQPSNKPDKTLGYNMFRINTMEFNRYISTHNEILPKAAGENREEENDECIKEVSDANCDTLPPVNGKRTRSYTFRRTQSAIDGPKAVMFQTPKHTSRSVKSANDAAGTSAWKRTKLMKAVSSEKRKQTSKESKVSFGQGEKKSDIDENGPGFVNQVRTFLDDLDSAYNERAHIVTEADRKPQFVKVQTLTKGSVFGLPQIVFGHQPSLCIVSNGAECILLSKEMFLEHCPPALMRRLRTAVSPYPSDEEMQANLVTRVNWDAYRQTTINSVVADVQELKIRHNYQAIEKPRTY